MKYEKEALEIVKLVGGESNISSLIHCATRLRFELKNSSKFQKQELEKLDYVLKVVVSGGQYQVVIGPAVDDYYQAIMKVAKISDHLDNESKKVKGNIIDNILKLISGSFSPLIGAMAGSGMIKAVLTLMLELGVFTSEDPTYIILSAVGNACFYFLPIFLGMTLAKQLKANTYVAGAIGAALLEPNFTSLIGNQGTNFLGIPVTAVDYSSTVFPIFIAVIIYALLEKQCKKIIPQSIQLFLVPMICLIVMVPFTVIFFGPFGTVIGNAISDFVMWLFSLSSTVAGIILGASYPFLTILGLHWGFTPVTLQNLELYGGDIIEAVGACAVWAQLGIAAAVYLKCKKNSRLRSIAGPTFVTGFFAGVTEPILYGIIMNYKRLLMIVAIGGGLGGAIVATLGCTYNEYVFHNIFSIILNCYSPIIYFVIAIFVTFTSSFALTYVWGLRREDIDENKEVKEINKNSQNDIKLEIGAPMKGKIIPLNQIEDEVFASGVAGYGVGIIPTDGSVVSPVDGKVTVVFPTKHAIGITTSEGVELLIHIGINTTMLNGNGFEVFVKQGDSVLKGQKLVHFDMEFISKMGYSLQSPVIITNKDNFKEIEIVGLDACKQNDCIYKIAL